MVRPAMRGTVDPLAGFEVVDDEADDDEDGDGEDGDWSSAGFLDLGRRLREPIPPRQYLLRDTDGAGVLPLNVNGVLAGSGGSGKSVVALQLAVAVAAGVPWLGRFEPAQEPWHVLVYAAEDDADEISRRLDAIIESVTGFADQPTREAVVDAIDERLHIKVVAGTDFQLTVADPSQPGEYCPGPAVDRIVRDLRRVRGPALVLADPLRRFTAGREDGAAMNAVIRALDQIRVHVQHPVNLIANHHSSKQSARTAEESAAAVRGATDLVDGVRWVMVMRRLTEPEAAKLGVTADRLDYRTYAVPKSNYTAESEGDHLRYHAGVFIDAELRSQNDTENALPGLLTVLRRLGAADEPVTLKALRPHARVRDGDIPISERRLPALVELAEERQLIEQVTTQVRGGNAGTARAVRLLPPPEQPT